MLGSLNLSAFVKEGKFNEESFRDAVRVAVDCLNEVLEEGLPLHPLQEQRDAVAKWRQIGLGIFGLADCLIKMQITYGSEKAQEFCRYIGRVMINSALQESAELAGKYGTYPEYNELVLESPFFKHVADIETIEKVKKYGLRNSQLLTIPPAGTISSLIGVSSGAEPIFANHYTRKTESLHNEEYYYKIYTPIVADYMKNHNILEEEDLPEWFVTAKDIKPLDRVKMQGALQEFIDASISSTINLPYEATEEEVQEIYYSAWKEHLKGVTIYRAGCKREGVLVEENKPKEEVKKPEFVAPTKQIANTLPRGAIIECSNDLIGKKRKIVSGCGSLHVLGFFDPVSGDLQEVYLNKGSTGGCVDADTEYFNGKEWKRIADYKEEDHEKVLQYNEDGTANLTLPINYIVNNNVKTLTHFTTNYGLDMVLSKDHRMFLYKNYRKFNMGMRSKLTHEIVTVDEYLNRKGSKERHVPTTFKMNMPGIPLSDNLIRLLVAVYADGCYDGYKIVISFKKERKKERLRELLLMCDIGWTERPIYNTDTTYFNFHMPPSVKDWFIDKQFTSKWYNCTDEQLKVIVDECIYWDGSKGEGNRHGEYFSSKKNEVDFIQFALTRLGYRATISDNTSYNSRVPSYRIRWTERNVHDLSFAKVEEYPTVDNKSYCFSVPSGLLVLRRNGKIFITGNCTNFMTGLSRTISLLCRAGVDIYTIKDQLDSTGTCPSYNARRITKHDTSKGACCPMAVGNALLEMYQEMQSEIEDDDIEDDDSDFTEITKPVIKEVNEVKKEFAKVENKTEPYQVMGLKCPECGEPLVFEGGCNSCKNCGYSKCE